MKQFVSFNTKYDPRDDRAHLVRFETAELAELDARWQSERTGDPYEPRRVSATNPGELLSIH